MRLTKIFSVKKTAGFLIGLLFFGFLAIRAQAAGAALYLSPTSGSFANGKTFSVSVYVSSVEQAMNAVSGAIAFPQDKLEATSVSKSGSIIFLWVVEPSIQNNIGRVNFEGIILNPGFTGTGGRVLTVTFKVKAAGLARLSFSSSSILANDGLGTNILSSVGSAQFDLGGQAVAPEVGVPKAEAVSATPNVPAGPAIISATHPDQNKWYQNNNPAFSWTLPSDITAVSFLLDQKSSANPGTISDGLLAKTGYTEVDDGVWYFHLRLKNNVGWGQAGHFRFQIDTQKPDDLAVTEIERTDLTDPRVKFTIQATDGLSGLDHFEIKLDDLAVQQWTPTADNIYETPALSYGQHQMEVKAADKAGNYFEKTVPFITKALLPPTLVEYPDKIQASEPFLVSGLADYPKARVTFWLQRDLLTPQSQAVLSDEGGKFIYEWSEGLKDGIWRLWAEVVDERGAKSEPSKKVTIIVYSKKWFDLREWPTDALITAIVFLAISVTLGILWQKEKRRGNHRRRHV